jgi:hypothetical protein
MYVIPDYWASMCGWIGLAYLPGTTAWVSACGQTNSQVYMHEMGHNFGFHHAGTFDNSGALVEYGDSADFMGNNQNSGCPNLAHRLTAGWMPASRVATVTYGVNTDVTIQELNNAPGSSDDLAAGSVPFGVVIADAAHLGTGYSWYLGYRKPTGYDMHLPSGLANMIHVHKWGGDFQQTWRHSTGLIGVGQSWTAPTDANFNVQFVSTSGEKAVLRITFSASTSTTSSGAAGTPVCGDGIVTAPETCDNSSPCCVNCQAQTGTVCRSALTSCDVAETCTAAGVCPSTDSVQPSGHVCAAATSPCQNAGVCDGTTKTCGAVSNKPAGTVCRAAVNSCDVAETCSTAGVCPADAFLTPCCGNGKCESGETCSTCPHDCPGVKTGPAKKQYCCQGSTCVGQGCRGVVCPH